MSLYLTQSIDNPLSYIDAGLCTSGLEPRGWDSVHGCWYGYYNPKLVLCPRHYYESTTSIQGFFYVAPPDDVFVLWTYGKIIDWPSWNVAYFLFDAATGALKERIDVSSVFGIVYINSVEWGDLNHLYATFLHTTDCKQINWRTGDVESTSWWIKPYSWNPKRIFSHILVDKQGDKILGVQYPNIEIWTGAYRGTPSLEWAMKLPVKVRDLAYESNSYGWVLTQDGQVYKISWGDYKRIEMVSSIQAYNPTDKGYYLAFDSLRQRLAVFRWMPDATDGAAQNRIEFYETVPQPAKLLDPVPVNRHKSGDFVKFISKIVGDMGEGFGGGQGDVSLVAPGNHGKVLSPTVLSGITGDLNISYQSPDTEVDVQDTIKIDVEYRDDISMGGGLYWGF